MMNKDYNSHSKRMLCYMAKAINKSIDEIAFLRTKPQLIEMVEERIPIYNWFSHIPHKNTYYEKQPLGTFISSFLFREDDSCHLEVCDVYKKTMYGKIIYLRFNGSDFYNIENFESLLYHMEKTSEKLNSAQLVEI